MVDTLEEVLVVEETIEDSPCEFWHDNRTSCDQTPEFIGYLTQCGHGHLACRRHYNIYSYGRTRHLQCESCGQTGYNLDLEWIPLS